MPPSSSSGCAVTMTRLARVRSFLRLCQSAAEPWLMDISRSPTAGSIEDKYGGCANAPAAIVMGRIPALLLDDRPIGARDLAPPAVQAVLSTAERCFSRSLLVELHAPAGLLADVQEAVFFLRHAMENFLGTVVELRVFEHPEVVRHHAECDIRHVTDGGNIARSVPGGSDAEHLAEGRDLARGREP